MRVRLKLTGVAEVQRMLGAAVAAVAGELDLAHHDGALAIQRHVAGRVPARTGRTRAAFADGEAVGRREGGGWEFGLRTQRLRVKGYRARWVEFGTKGHRTGRGRALVLITKLPRIGRNGKPIGRPRKQRRPRSGEVRFVEGQPARPFFRPGVEAARSELTIRWRQAVTRAVQPEVVVRARQGWFSAFDDSAAEWLIRARIANLRDAFETPDDYE